MSLQTIAWILLATLYLVSSYIAGKILFKFRKHMKDFFQLNMSKKDELGLGGLGSPNMVFEKEKRVQDIIIERVHLGCTAPTLQQCKEGIDYLKSLDK